MAAVATFAAYTRATSPSLQRYVIALRTIAPGARITGADLGTAPMKLPASLAATAAFSNPSQLVGATTVAPITKGELIEASSVVSAKAAVLRRLSFPLPAARALGGNLRPGERVDVIATFGNGATAYTSEVASHALVVANSGLAAGAGGASLAGSGFAGNGQDVITLAIANIKEALAISEAVDSAQVLLVAVPSSSSPAQGALAGPYSPPAPSSHGAVP